MKWLYKLNTCDMSLIIQNQMNVMCLACLELARYRNNRIRLYVSSKKLICFKICFLSLKNIRFIDHKK